MDRANDQSAEERVPIDVDGQLVLDEASRDVAARLAHEAVHLADAALPHAAQQRLLQRLARRQRRDRLVRVGVLCFFGLAIGVAGVWLGQRNWSAPGGGSISGIAAERQSNSVVSSNTTAGGDFSRSQDADSKPWPYLSVQDAPAETFHAASDAEKIELLEMALERYRAAVQAQQERIRELEAELNALRARFATSHHPPRSASDLPPDNHVP